MPTEKKLQLEYLKKEEKRLEQAIEHFLSYDLEDMAMNASKLLKVVQEKIKELE